MVCRLTGSPVETGHCGDESKQETRKGSACPSVRTYFMQRQRYDGRREAGPACQGHSRVAFRQAPAHSRVEYLAQLGLHGTGIELGDTTAVHHASC